MTPQRPEPLPPAGVNAGRLHDVLAATFGADIGDELFKWAAVDHPAWARQNAHDAEDLKAWCAEHNGKPAQ